MSKVRKNIIQEFLDKTKFYSGDSIGKHIETNQFLEKIYLSDILFSVRFKNVLNKTECISLYDLLNCDYFYFLGLRNCGRKSIRDARISIYNYLTDKISNQKFYQLSFNDQENLILDHIPDLVSNKKAFNNYKFIPILDNSVKINDENFNKLQQIELSQLNFSKRIINYLSYRNIKKMSELLSIEYDNLIKEKNIGRKSLLELRDTIIELVKDEEKIDKFLQKQNVLDIIEEFMDDLDAKSKNIFEMRYGRDSKANLANIGKKYDLTKERVRQIIESKINVLRKNFEKKRNEYLKYFFNIIEKKLEPITLETLEDKPLFTRKYTEKLYLRLLTEIFWEVPFLYTKTKNFSLKIRKSKAKKRNRFSLFYQKLEKLELPFGKVTLERLFTHLKVNNQKDKLIVFKIIFNLDEYVFTTIDNFGISLIRKGSLQAITKDILEGTKKPKTISQILEIIRKHYGKTINYASITSVVGNIKQNEEFYQMDRYLFGLEKHFGYPKKYWPNIASDIKNYMRKLRRQTNAAELFDHIKEKYPKLRSKYELVHILRTDNEIIDLKFYNYSLEESGNNERLLLTDVISEIFNENPYPKHFKEVYNEISKKRFVRIEGMNSLLNQQDYLNYYKGGYYGLQQYHNENLHYLMNNETFIEKIINYEVFPDTSLNNIAIFINADLNKFERIWSIRKTKCLYIYEDLQSNKQFLISKNWSPIKIARCVTFNLNRIVFWEEMQWLLRDLNIRIDPNTKYKIAEHKNIKMEGNRLSYFEISLTEDDSKDILEICYEMLKTNMEPTVIDDLNDFINNELIKVTKEELLYLLKNDEKFLILDEQLVMVQ